MRFITYLSVKECGKVFLSIRGEGKSLPYFFNSAMLDLTPINNTMSAPAPIEQRSNIEWWSFDAVSDDGSGLVSIRFFNCHILASGGAKACPAVSFVYAADGKQVCHSVVEFAPEALKVQASGVSIGCNAFTREVVDYGSGYVVNLSLPLRRRKRLEATLEWLSLSHDDDSKPASSKSGCGEWRIDSPRSDVSGRISVVPDDGQANLCNFRGTGSHYNYRSGSDGDAGFGVRLSGSAHFVDSAVFFCREGQLLSEATHASVSILDESGGSETIATSAEDYWARTRYGIRYPRRFLLTTDDAKLRIKLMMPYESELCFARFPAEVTLTLPDEKQRKAIGCVEILEPRRMRSNIVRWVSGMGVQRQK